MNVFTRNKVDSEKLKELFPGRLHGCLAVFARQPGYAFKLRTDFQRFAATEEEAAKALFGIFPTDRQFRLADNAPANIATLAHFCKPRYVDGQPLVGYSMTAKEILELPHDYMAPTIMATRADTEALMQEVGWKFANGMYDAAGHKIDLGNHEINGDRLMSAGVAISPLGHAVHLDRDTVMYMVISILIRYSRGEQISGLEAAAIREGKARMASFFDSDKVGDADEQRTNLVLSKMAVMRLKFDQFGIGLDEAVSKDKGALYSSLSNRIVGMGGHAQGKYFIHMSAVGIYIDENKLTSPMGVQFESVLGEQTQACLDIEAIVGSTDLAKWFKRLTIGALQTARLVSPETGYMTINGATQQGKDIEFLYVAGGIALPYKGAAVSLVNRKTMGGMIAHYREQLYRERIPGEHTASGHAVGTKVKPGDILAQVGGMKILCKREGVVLENKRMVIDGETHITVNVGTIDTTGQFKGRDNSGHKLSMHYCDWTGAPWHAILPALGHTNAKIHGDLAIIGLKAGDDPKFMSNEDTLKGTGKGLAMGRINLAAQTLRRKTDYKVENDYKGLFKDLENEFEAKAQRSVITYHAVDIETFELVSQAIGVCAHPGVSVFQFPYEGTLYNIIRQEAIGYVARTLIKVESLPVADNHSSQRTPGEIAIAADGQGMDLVARDLMRDAGKARLEYVQLQKAAWSMYCMDTTKPMMAIRQTFAGQQTFMTGINIMKPIPASVKARLAELCETNESILKLKDCIVIGAFDDDGDALPNAQRDDGGLTVALDPTVLKSFGGGEDESSIETLSRDLCWMIANDRPLTDINRAINRLRGAMQTAAKAESVAKQRLNRGAWGVNCRARAGFVPTGWVAASYYGNWIRRQAKLNGWDGNGHPADFMSGRDCIMGRSPQSQPTPQRIWIADAPADAIEAYKKLGNWPEGAVRFGVNTGDTLEPDTCVHSALAISNQNGDVDGDGVLNTVIDSEAAAKQARTFDWRAQRLTIINFYMNTVKDPAVWAFEHDPKKLKWAKPTKTTVANLVSLTAKSIRNQTLHIGVAHSHGHAALVMADLYPGRGHKAQALMFGHYEEQLAGMSQAYYEFYENLGRERDLGGAKWEALMRKLNAAVGDGHTVPKSGDDFDNDWAMFKAAHSIVDGYMYVGRNQKTHAIMLKPDGSYALNETLLVVAAGVYRCLSKGQLGNPFLKFVIETGLLPILDRARKGSLVVELIQAFFKEVYPEVDVTKFPGGEMGDLL